MSLPVNLLFTLLVSFSTLIYLDCNAALVVKRFQFHPYTTSSMALTFSAEIFNDGREDLNMSGIPARLEMIVCCQFLQINDPRLDVFKSSEKDCYSMRVHSGLAYYINNGRTRNVQAFYVNEYVVNRQGACAFRIHGVAGNGRGNEIRINFDTVVRAGNNATEGSGMQACTSLDQDPRKSCEVVDCMKKYGGFRSFYNTTTSSCEPTPECMDGPKGPASIEELERLDHHPSVILDYKNNTCVKLEKEKSVAIRDVHEENETTTTTESVAQFARTYGISVSKLAAAIFLSVVVILIVCVLLNLLCGCFCSCQTWLADLIPYRKAPRNDKIKTKYKRIKTEDDGNADKVIEEVKERREMRRPSPQENEPELKTQISNRNSSTSQESKPPSRRDSRDSRGNVPDTGESQDDVMDELNGSASGMRKNSKDLIAQKFGTKASEPSKRLPDVNQLLMQFNDLRQKKSQPQSDASRIYSQLAEAYGNARNKMAEPTTSGQLQPRPNTERLWKQQAYTMLVHRSSQYEAPMEIRKETKGVQFEEMGGGAVAKAATSKTGMKLPPLPPRASRSASNALSNCSCGKTEGGVAKSEKLLSAISPPTSVSNYNSSHENLQNLVIPYGNRSPSVAGSSGGWSHAALAESIDRSYQLEMAQAANFLRGLEERQREKQMETIHENPNKERSKEGNNPFQSPVLNSSRNSNQNIVQKMAPQLTDPNVPRSSHVMRRMKEEPPIPMSMIRADFKFSDQSVVQSPNRISSSGLIGSSERGIGGEDYPLTGSGMVTEEPLNIITMDNAGSVEDAKTGYGILKSSLFSRSKAVKFKDMQSKGTSPGEFRSDLKRSTSDTVADRVEKSGQSFSRKFEMVLPANSENLVHSPPALSASESSSAINSSNASMHTFFDNDLVPGVKTFSNSDEKLHQRRWIDAFVREVR